MDGRRIWRKMFTTVNHQTWMPNIITGYTCERNACSLSLLINRRNYEIAGVTRKIDTPSRPVNFHYGIDAYPAFLEWQRFPCAPTHVHKSVPTPRIYLHGLSKGRGIHRPGPTGSRRSKKQLIDERGAQFRSKKKDKKRQSTGTRFNDGGNRWQMQPSRSRNRHCALVW